MSACSELLGRRCDGSCEADPQLLCPYAFPSRLHYGSDGRPFTFPNTIACCGFEYEVLPGECERCVACDTALCNLT